MGQNLRIAKAKNTVILQPRQGRWIPLSCNFDHRKNNEFLFPVLFNTLIERNLIASKISPQAEASRSCAIYIINNNDIFVQVKRGDARKPWSRTRRQRNGPREGTETVQIMFTG